MSRKESITCQEDNLNIAIKFQEKHLKLEKMDKPLTSVNHIIKCIMSNVLF